MTSLKDIESNFHNNYERMFEKNEGDSPKQTQTKLREKFQVCIVKQLYISWKLYFKYTRFGIN